MENSSSIQSAVYHQRLLAGDVTASAEIAETFLPVLVQYLSTRFPSLHDPHLVETAAEDALLNYLQGPQKYDPSKLDLERYLRMAARYDLKNELAKSMRDIGTLRNEQVVELDGLGTELQIEDTSRLHVENQIEILVSPVWTQLLDLLPDPVDLELIILMMEGVRDTDEYAEVLSIKHLTRGERAEQVKRHKDRLKKKLQRRITRSELTKNE